MRVAIGAFGTRGDVQPMLALAHALQARGHSVALAVPPNAVAQAASQGLAAHGCGVDYEEVARSSAGGTLGLGLKVIRLLRGEVESQLTVLEALAANADLVVGCSVITVGSLVAEHLALPYAFFAFFPQMLRSTEHPSPLLLSHGLPRWVNALSWKANTVFWNQVLLKELNKARATRRLRPVASAWGALSGRYPALATDARLGPAPSDHPVPVAQPGPFWLVDSSALSQQVEAFLAAGPPPVFIGFGSMSDGEPARTTERLVESVRAARVRAIISRGWAGLGLEGAGEEILFCGSEPHARLFPRCAAVVHHGGAGTTHQAARAGVPQVVMPQVLDQFYWAHRLTRLGLGVVVPRHADDPALLADALRRCVSDGALRDRARAFAVEITSDGVDRAVQHLEAVVAQKPAR